MSRQTLSTLLVVAGMASVSAGAFVIHVAAGLITAGVALLAFGLLMVEVSE